MHTRLLGILLLFRYCALFNNLHRFVSLCLFDYIKHQTWPLLHTFVFIYINRVVGVSLLARQPDQWRPQLYSVFFCSLVFRGRNPWKLQRICILQYLKLGLKYTKKHMDGNAFFHVHCSKKLRENSKRSKSLNSQVFVFRTKCVCFVFLAG